MLNLRQETECALHFLKRLAKRSTPLSLKEMAEQSGLSFLFLQKVARKLRLAGLIRAQHGVTGGYVLSVPASKLSVNRVIETMEGGCCLLRCFKGDGQCLKFKTCRLRSQLDKVNRAVVKMLEKMKVNEL